MIEKIVKSIVELHRFEWEYRGKKFVLYGEDSLVLKQTDTFDNCGLLGSISLRYIGLLNLTELEFYGLKVIIEEQPKLILKDKECLEIFIDNIYIARDQTGNLWLYDGKPIINVHSECVWGKGNGCRDEMLEIDKSLFSFITWESQKAWSKDELLKLEVEE